MAPGMMPKKVEITKRRAGTSRNAGMRFATKNGTTGRSRIRNSMDHWLSSIPSLIFFTTPSEPSSFAPSRAPKLVCAARKIAVAPMVARRDVEETRRGRWRRGSRP
jgi:ApbE superfamily uncharacterized protein (UPF0280 family)